MAVHVVDLLEVVKVDQEEGEVGVRGQRGGALSRRTFVLAQRECHVALDVLSQVAPVVQSGERIGQTGGLELRALQLEGARERLERDRAFTYRGFELLLAPLQQPRTGVDQTEAQHHHERQQAQAQPDRLPPLGHHLNVDPQFVGAPIAAAVGRTRAQHVVACRQVAVGGHTKVGAGLDPFRVEPIEPVGVANAARIAEFERRNLDAEAPLIGGEPQLRGRRTFCHVTAVDSQFRDHQ